MELEEAIKILKYQLANRNTDVYTPINYEAMGVVLNHLTKQEKMIDLMAEHIETGCDFDNRITNKVQIKQYFEKKVEEEING